MRIQKAKRIGILLLMVGLVQSPISAYASSGSTTLTTVVPDECEEHTWNDGVIVKEPTCTSKGEKLFTCTACGATETKEIDMISHKWNTNYTIDIPATHLKTGIKSIHCSICNTIKLGSEVSIPIPSGTWKKNSTGWWYSYADGSYAKSEIALIGGKYYGFNAKGYMVTGWYSNSGVWYYANSSGAFVSGWIKVSGVWYYLNPSNYKMVTGFQTIGGATYYLKSSGAMATGWQKFSNKWYYFNSSGAMAKKTWVQTSYYVDKDGVMVSYAYIKNGSKYYWVNSSGKYTKTYAQKDTVGYKVYEQSTGVQIQ